MQLQKNKESTILERSFSRLLRWPDRKRVAFGILNATGTFQRAMNTMLVSIKERTGSRVFYYKENIIIEPDTAEDQKATLKFKRKPLKCSIMVNLMQSCKN